MRRVLYLFGSVFAALVFLCAGPVSAQTASLAGTVYDAAGGVVQGTKVTITNTETGATREVTSNETGLYRITPLVPGHYSLSFEKDGFKSLPRRGSGSDRE